MITKEAIISKTLETEGYYVNDLKIAVAKHIVGLHAIQIRIGKVGR